LPPFFIAPNVKGPAGRLKLKHQPVAERPS